MSQFRIILESQDSGNLLLDLPHVNWQDASRTVERDNKYLGFVIKYTIALEFAKDGYDFIQTVYENFGFDSVVTIKILELNLQLAKYEKYFEGNLDFSTYKAGETTLEIDAVQLDDIQKILNSDDIEINILSNQALDGATLPDFSPFLREVTLQGQTLERDYESNATTQASIEPDEIQPSFIEGISEFRFYVYPQLQQEIIENDYEDEEIPSYPFGVSALQPSSVLKWLLKPEYDGEYNLTINWDFTANVDLTGVADIEQVTIAFRIEVFRDRNEEFETTFGSGKIGDVLSEGFASSVINPSAGTQQVDIPIEVVNYTKTLNLKRGDRVYIVPTIEIDPLFLNDPALAVINLTQDQNQVVIEGKTTMPDTTIQAVYEHDAIARVVDIILGRFGAFRSDFLGKPYAYGFEYNNEGQESNFMLTNGSYLRQEGNGSLLFKLSDLFEQLRKKYNVGLSFEEDDEGMVIVRLEQIDYIFNNQESEDIGCVSGLDKKIDDSRIYNSVVYGAKQEKPDLNKTDKDFNNRKTRKIPVNSIKNELDLGTDYIVQGSVLEEIRRNVFRAVDDQDKSRDDDIFGINTFVEIIINDVLVINSANGVQEYLTSYNSAENLDDSYNLAQHPFLLYKKYYGKDIKSIFIKQIDLLGRQYNDNFVSGIDLKDVEIVQNGVNYNEPAVNSINDYQNPIWIPEIYNFDKELSVEKIRNIEENLNNFITFEDRKGNKKTGYLLSMEITDATRLKKVQFEILRRYAV